MNAKQFLDWWHETNEKPQDNDTTPCSIVKRGDWISDGKSDCRETIYCIGEQFFGILESRCGSSYSGFDYEPEECTELVPQTITKVVYAPREE